MSREASSTEEIREVAILHHHDMAPLFESTYQEMAKDRFWNEFTYGRQKVDVVLENELKRLPPGAAVLDIGCGTGSYLQRYKELGFTPSGLEPADAMRQTAVRTNPGVDIRDGVATELPFQDGSFDFISAIEVYRYLHLADTRASLAECRRVLKPGGVLFVTLVNRWALDGFFLLQRARQVATGKDFNRRHPHCEFFSPREAKEELARAGLVKARTVGRLFAPMRMIYKVNSRLGAATARRIEVLDDFVHEFSLTTPFAGHLIAIAERGD